MEMMIPLRVVGYIVTYLLARHDIYSIDAIDEYTIFGIKC